MDFCPELFDYKITYSEIGSEYKYIILILNNVKNTAKQNIQICFVFRGQKLHESSHKFAVLGGLQRNGLEHLTFKPSTTTQQNLLIIYWTSTF